MYIVYQQRYCGKGVNQKPNRHKCPPKTGQGWSLQVLPWHKQRTSPIARGSMISSNKSYGYSTIYAPPAIVFCTVEFFQLFRHIKFLNCGVCFEYCFVQVCLV